MNANLLYEVVAVNIEDPSVTRHLIGRWLFADLVHQNGVYGWRSSDWKRLLNKAVKLCIIDGGGLVSLLKVLIVWVVAFKMANTGRGVKCKAKIVTNLNPHGLHLDMTIISLIHALHRLCLGLRCNRRNRGTYKHHIPSKTEEGTQSVQSLDYHSPTSSKYSFSEAY